MRNAILHDTTRSQEADSAPVATVMSQAQQQDFWRRYAAEAQPAIERACRSASRKLTDNGMSPEDMMAWVDDRVWKLLRRNGWPFFHDAPTAETAASRINSSVGTLARWAYLALSRKHWRRKVAQARYTNGLSRAERLSMVTSSASRLEEHEELGATIEQIRSSVSQRVRARISASWHEPAERRRVAMVLGATESEDEQVLQAVERGEVAPNTIDQMRSRSRRDIRDALAGVMRRAMIVAIGVVSLGLASAPAFAGGEQTGGGRGGSSSRVDQDTPHPVVERPGEQTGGGRGD